MTTIMIHAIHGEGYPPVNGSIGLDLLEKAAKSPHRLTFDDGLACQELAFPILKKYGKTAIFFINNENIMEIHRAIRERLGELEFYMRIWRALGYKPLAPKDFLAEYSFYSQDDKDYRYYRDYIDPITHDKILWVLKEPCDTVRTLDPARIVEERHVIGLHTKSHPRRLDIMPAHLQLDEWLDNLGMIRQFQKRGGYLYASYPMGRSNEVTKEILAILGVTEAFTSSQHSSGYYESPRIDIKQIEL